MEGDGSEMEGGAGEAGTGLKMAGGALAGVCTLRSRTTGGAGGLGSLLRGRKDGPGLAALVSRLPVAAFSPLPFPLAVPAPVSGVEALSAVVGWVCSAACSARKRARS